MIFTRTRTYHFPVQEDELKKRLVGRHVKIHNLDFEIFEKENRLSIIPHAEEVEEIKTLPITNLIFSKEGDKTKVVVTSRIRNLDSGGPLILIAFSTFMILAAMVLFLIRYDTTVAITLITLGLAILMIFRIRMQTGYFDYVHKVNDYIKEKAAMKA